ncbi:MAG: DNA polymerase III subunit gamma/tau, partial [Sphaerochaetaceae bacterium]|nr:DNA polymerase III subunit gamma/tau [Sphaerochaetaceae bacterium]
MAYEVTATRKRPQTFDNLVGQEFVVSTIKNSIKSNRIAHAYLFCGPRGVGKTSSARLLAKALNCEKGPTPTPCGVCELCKEITKGNCSDVIEIDGASNNSVDDIRNIKEEVRFHPQKGRYKIYIIDEVHMLSKSAFNALLKTIEEPPSYTIFIFATTETQKVPATIRSRCQQFHFQLINIETISNCLKDATKDLNIKAEDDAIFWIAKEATGSMRDAYTLFDQIVSFSDEHITLEKIKDKLGLVGFDQINIIITNLLTKNMDKVVYSLNNMLLSGISVEQCIKDFASYFRTILLLKQGINDPNILGAQVKDIPEIIINSYTTEQIEAGFELFINLYKEIKYSINPRFELELAINKLQNLQQLASPVVVMQKINQLKKEILLNNINKEDDLEESNT